MENKFNTPWSPVGDKTNFGYILNCNGNRLDLEQSWLLNRVAQCVNACAGMDDPVAEVQRLKNKAAWGMLEPVVSEKVESLYTGSTETLEGAIAHAKECGFSFADSGITAADWSVKNTPEFFFKNPESKHWHETGELPPVGTECEINEPKMSYDGRKVHVFAHYNGRAFAWDEIEESAYHSDNPSEFRPIQTEKQKIIKEMLWCFDGFFNGEGDNAGQVCEKIYDQFIAKK